MAGPLLKSKYRVPVRRPGAVPAGAWRIGWQPPARSPLTLRVRAGRVRQDDAADRVAGRSAADGAAVAWLSLDRRDNDPALFWTYVVTALQAAVDGVGAGALALLASSSPRPTRRSPPCSTTWTPCRTTWSWCWTTTTSIEAAEVHDGMTFLLEHQPPQLHLVLATRADPPLPLARLRAARRAGRGAGRRPALHRRGGRGLPQRVDGAGADERRRRRARTGGPRAGSPRCSWPRCRCRAASDVGAFIAGLRRRRPLRRRLPRRGGAGPPARRRPGLPAPDLDPGPADRPAVRRGHRAGRRPGDAGGARAGQPVPRPARRPAPVVPLPPPVRRRAAAPTCSTSSRTEVAELHRRASAWFAANGDAGRRRSATRSPAATSSRAADLMELAMPVMRRNRREAELARWMRALPDEVLRPGRCSTSAFVGALAQARSSTPSASGSTGIERRSARRTAPGRSSHRRGLVVVDHDGYRSLPAHVEMYRAALALATATWTAPSRTPAKRCALAPPDDAPGPGGGGRAGRARVLGHRRPRRRARGLHRVRRGPAPAPGSSPTSSAAPSPWATSGAPRAGSAPRCARTRQASTWPPRRRAPSRCAARPTCTSASPGCCWSATTSPAPAEHLAASQRLGEQQRPAAEPVPLAGRRWPGCGRPRATSTPRSSLLDEAERVYDGDYSPNVRPVPARGPGSGCGAGELAHARGLGPGTAASRRGRRSPTCASTSTSPWPGCSSPGTARAGRRRRSGRP